MSFPFLLCIHSYGGANETVKRHWPFYEMSGASRIVGIGTEKHDCVFPDGIQSVEMGDGAYLNGSNLCLRLLETISWFLTQHENHLVCAEYDVLFFKPIRPFTGVCSDRTGGKTWGSKGEWFGHSPWCIDRDSAYPVLNEMVKIISEGHCSYGTPESSPDVFWGWACERAGIPVNHDHFRLFTRNTIESEEDLKLARQARLDGADCIHGVKTEAQLSFITQ